uniref:Serine/threonine kinase 11 interacting protein n=1 Tax=Ailuropoda melanoleuca TaxID=9646 RepID=A0A7N5KEQ8_AILME
MTTAQRDSLVWKLAGLLRESGDVVLSGCSTLSLLTVTLQQLNHVFELHLGPWGPGQTGFVALPSHPADSPAILQLQFLFDVLQKTLSLKVLRWEWSSMYEEPRSWGGGGGHRCKKSAGPILRRCESCGWLCEGGEAKEREMCWPQ